MIDIQKALTTAEGTGTIIPERLDPMLQELANKSLMIRKAIKAIPWSTNAFQWNVRSALTSAGFYNESDTFSSGNSTYARRMQTIEMMKAEGQVSNLLQETSGGYIDALQSEIEGAVESLMQAEERALIMGNYNATYTDTDSFDGLATQITQTQDALGNSIGSVAGLNAIDEAIRTIQAVGGKHDLIIVSTRDQMKLNQYMRSLMTYNWMQMNQKLGTVVPTYMNIPIIQSQFVPTNLAFGTTPATDNSIALVLDTSAIVIPRVRDVSYERVATSVDGIAFRVKLYETLAVKAAEKQVVVTNLG